MTFEEPQPQPHTIYYSPTTAHSFCISSTYPTIMAVFMKSEIHEVNRSQSQNYGLVSSLDINYRLLVQLTRSGSVSSSGLHREHITYSYPDTEDEEDEINSDSGSEVIPSQSPRHIKRREPKHAHHSVKPPNSSALVLSAATNRVQSEDKSFQSRSLENLQALKRSFGMGKIDHFRSPGGPSSTSSCESKEQMITLKRHVSVTCAESHTQFPLCTVSFTR
ncbi:hypothetical protein BDF14DRAFT_1724180 [Spinellus fusiger]|nr:hypothetical protein BDF14DRAFT_1724180 [Spinellus fusiger]